MVPTTPVAQGVEVIPGGEQAAAATAATALAMDFLRRGTLGSGALDGLLPDAVEATLAAETMEQQLRELRLRMGGSPHTPCTPLPSLVGAGGGVSGGGGSFFRSPPPPHNIITAAGQQHHTPTTPFGEGEVLTSPTESMLLDECDISSANSSSDISASNEVAAAAEQQQVNLRTEEVGRRLLLSGASHKEVWRRAEEEHHAKVRRHARTHARTHAGRPGEQEGGGGKAWGGGLGLGTCVVFPAALPRTN
jgi:hypothetical protein